MAPADEAEGRYLCAILNSEAARERVAQYQSRGQWGARDFDKVMFTLPIPRFSAKERLHRALVEAAARAGALRALVGARRCPSPRSGYRRGRCGFGCRG